VAKRQIAGVFNATQLANLDSNEKDLPTIHPKIKVARLIETAKHDIKKYMKRKRRKELPKGTDFWGFDFRYGSDEASAKSSAVALHALFLATGVLAVA
jgi:hypothetical protein